MGQALSTMSPPISVVLPVRSPAPWFCAALDSVLRQTHRQLEVLVVDDGSPDTGYLNCEHVSDSRVRVIELSEQRGVGAALNRGLDSANHPLVARMDADDVSLPHRLAQQVLMVEADPSLWAVASGVRSMGPAGEPRRGAIPALTLAPRDVRFNLLVGNVLYHPTVLFNRTVGSVRYTEGVAYEDWDLWLRHIDRHVATTSELLLAYRMHPESATTTRRRQAVGELVDPYVMAYRTVVGGDPSHAFVRSVTGADQRYVNGMAGDLLAIVRTFVPGATWSGRRLMTRTTTRLLRRWASATVPALSRPT